MRKPEVGDELYMVARPKKTRFYLCTVKRVGRKWFYVDSPYGKDAIFSVETWEPKAEQWPRCELFESELDYRDELKRGDLRRLIFKEACNLSRNLSLERLTKIAELLGVSLEDA